MAGIPQQAQLPGFPRDWSDPRDLKIWGEAIQAAIQYLYRTQAFALNATFKVGLHADRSATPVLNEIFWYSTDTDHLYGAVDGVWVELT